MYRILLADDEGIMLTSLTNIIKGHFGNQCEIATAKTGRVALELAREFRPDLIFMDIRMPGLSGIEAMQELRKTDSNVLIVVVTAYDKFDYAKEALGLHAFDFLTKPVNKNVIIDVVTRAMNQIDKEKFIKINNLRIQEKLETVVPMIESGFISNIVMQGGEKEENAYYRELLDIQEDYGFVMVVRFGEELKDGVLTNPVGISMRAQKFYKEMRDMIKDVFHCVIGPVMGNRMIVAVPCQQSEMEYEERIHEIENARRLVGNLERGIDAKFRVGIGKIYPLEALAESYREAYQSLNAAKNHVIHYEDITVTYGFEEDYPRETEDRFFELVEKGDMQGACEQANTFFDWLKANAGGDLNEIRLKVLELLMEAEKKEFENNGGNYSLHQRKGYLTTVMSMEEDEDIRKWFLNKIGEVCHIVQEKQAKQVDNAVANARKYIQIHYGDTNISLESVSRVVNMSPYYFSRLFKEEAKINFIDYLTSIRIKKAKELLEDATLSIKEVCNQSGYGDPNYFSRIFKKLENETPSEYRERILK